MSDKFDPENVEEFRKELSTLINEMSKKILDLISESNDEVSVEMLTMALIELSASIAVQGSCSKDIYLLISGLAHKRATKVAISSLYKDVSFNLKKKKELN